MTSEQTTILKYAQRKIQELATNEELFTHTQLNIHYDEKAGLQQNSTRPSNVAIKAAVADIRQFWMPNSDFQLNKLYRIIAPHLDKVDVERLKEYRKIWHKLAELQGNESLQSIELILNEEKWSSYTLLDYMFNGDIMHTEKAKAAKLDLLRDTPMFQVAEMMMIGTLQDMANVLFAIDGEFIVQLLKAKPVD